MTEYITEVHELRINEQIISVVNLTPCFRENQKSVVKKTIEQQLYEVFCKYMLNKPEQRSISL